MVEQVSCFVFRDLAKPDDPIVIDATHSRAILQIYDLPAEVFLGFGEVVFAVGFGITLRAAT
jgi:hypothetical protein